MEKELFSMSNRNSGELKAIIGPFLRERVSLRWYVDTNNGIQCGGQN